MSETSAEPSDQVHVVGAWKGAFNQAWGFELEEFTQNQLDRSSIVRDLIVGGALMDEFVSKEVVVRHLAEQRRGEVHVSLHFTYRAGKNEERLIRGRGKKQKVGDLTTRCMYMDEVGMCNIKAYGMLSFKRDGRDVLAPVCQKHRALLVKEESK